jgi:hypothetical protein
VADRLNIGILFAVFLFIDGAAAWLLGIYFSDPVQHMTLSPYAPYGLYGGPVLLIAACLLAFICYYYLARREPDLPRIITPVPPTQLTPPTQPTSPTPVWEPGPKDGQREERLPEPEKRKK